MAAKGLAGVKCVGGEDSHDWDSELLKARMLSAPKWDGCITLQRALSCAICSEPITCKSPSFVLSGSDARIEAVKRKMSQRSLTGHVPPQTATSSTSMCVSDMSICCNVCYLLMPNPEQVVQSEVVQVCKQEPCQGEADDNEMKPELLTQPMKTEILEPAGHNEIKTEELEGRRENAIKVLGPHRGRPRRVTAANHNYRLLAGKRPSRSGGGGGGPSSDRV